MNPPPPPHTHTQKKSQFTYISDPPIPVNFLKMSIHSLVPSLHCQLSFACWKNKLAVGFSNMQREKKLAVETGYEASLYLQTALLQYSATVAPGAIVTLHTTATGAKAIPTCTNRGMQLSCLISTLLLGSRASRWRAPTLTSTTSSMYTPSCVCVCVCVCERVCVCVCVCVCM